MPDLLLTPPDLDLELYAGNTSTIKLEFPDGYAAGKVFTARILTRRDLVVDAAVTVAGDDVYLEFAGDDVAALLDIPGRLEVLQNQTGRPEVIIGGKVRTSLHATEPTTTVVVLTESQAEVKVFVFGVGPPGPAGPPADATWAISKAGEQSYVAVSRDGRDDVDTDVTLLFARCLADLAGDDYVGTIHFLGSAGETYRWGEAGTGAVPVLPAGVGGTGTGRLVLSANPSVVFQLTAQCPRMFNPPVTTPDTPLTVRNVTFDGFTVDRNGLGAGLGFHHILFGSTKAGGGTAAGLSFDNIRVTGCKGYNAPIDPTNHFASFWLKFDIFGWQTTLTSAIGAHNVGDSVTVGVTDPAKLPATNGFGIIVEGERLHVTAGAGTSTLTATCTANPMSHPITGVTVMLDSPVSCTDVVERECRFVGGNAGFNHNGGGSSFEWSPYWIDDVQSIDCVHEMFQYPSGNIVQANGPLLVDLAADSAATSVRAAHFVEYPASDLTTTWTLTVNSEKMLVVGHAANSDTVTVQRAASGTVLAAHPAGSAAITPAFGAHFQTGQSAPVGRVYLENCRGRGTGDVAFEMDNVEHLVQIGCEAEDAQGFAYLAANFVTPKAQDGTLRLDAQRYEYANCRYKRTVAHQGYGFVLNHPNASIPFGSATYTDCGYLRTTKELQFIGEAWRMFSAAQQVTVINPKITIDGLFANNAPGAVPGCSFVYVNGPAQFTMRNLDLTLVADHDPLTASPAINLVELRGDSQPVKVDIENSRCSLTLSHWQDANAVPVSINLVSVLSGTVSGRIHRVDLPAVPATGKVVGINVAASPGLTIPTQLEIGTAGLYLLPAAQQAVIAASQSAFVTRSPLLNLDESTPGAEVLWARLSSGAWVPQQRRLDPPVVFTGVDATKRVLQVQPAQGQSVNVAELGAVTLLSDTFTAADGTLLTAHTADTGQGPWTVTNWAPTIVGGAVAAAGASSTDQYALVDCGAFDGVLSAVVNVSAVASEAGVLFRSADANNWLSVDLTYIPANGVNQVRLWKRTGGGAGATLATGQNGVVPGLNMIVVTMIADRIVVFLNGVQRILYTLTSGELATYGTLTKIGWKDAVRAGADDGTTTFDNLLFQIPAWTMDRYGMVHATAGTGQPVRAGAGKTKLSDADFPGAAFDGLAGPVRDSSDGKSYWSWRANGAWFSVEGG